MENRLRLGQKLGEKHNVSLWNGPGFTVPQENPYFKQNSCIGLQNVTLTRNFTLTRNVTLVSRNVITYQRE